MRVGLGVVVFVVSFLVGAIVAVEAGAVLCTGWEMDSDANDHGVCPFARGTKPTDDPTYYVYQGLAVTIVAHNLQTGASLPIPRMTYGLQGGTAEFATRAMEPVLQWCGNVGFPTVGEYQSSLLMDPWDGETWQQRITNLFTQDLVVHKSVYLHYEGGGCPLKDSGWRDIGEQFATFSIIPAGGARSASLVYEQINDPSPALPGTVCTAENATFPGLRVYGYTLLTHTLGQDLTPSEDLDCFDPEPQPHPGTPEWVLDEIPVSCCG